MAVRFTFKIISSLLHLVSDKNEESGLFRCFLALTSVSSLDDRTRRMIEGKFIAWMDFQENASCS